MPSLHPPGVQPGDQFASRAELRGAGVHLPLQAGIDQRGGPVAQSIVLSGGYADDVDFGERLIYTGHGGQEPGSKVQTADQHWDRGNVALYRAFVRASPVWVTRGPDLRDTPFPTSGTYVYGGAFHVTDAWREPGQAGFLVCRFRMVMMVGLSLPKSAAEPVSDAAATARVEAVVQRLIRNSTLTREVKRIHADRCQVCAVAVAVRHETTYSEGAHIRPLGMPHNGPDSLDNLLCLCPNDHVRFDMGAIVVDEDLLVVDRVAGSSGPRLRTHEEHHVDLKHFAYHRALFA